MTFTATEIRAVTPAGLPAAESLRRERTWYTANGSRLRTEIRSANGDAILRMHFLLDEDERETGALYFEGNETEPNYEQFTMSADGRKRTIRYTSAGGELQETTEEILDERGRVRSKRFLRADGTAYGVEQVRHTAGGELAGWTFRRLGNDRTARFDYRYLSFDEFGSWTRRLKLRDGKPLEQESRVVRYAEARAVDPEQELAVFGWGAISTWNRDEISPSFAPDGRLLWLRAEDDALARTVLFAVQWDSATDVRELKLPHAPYTARFSRDGRGVFYSTRDPDATPEITSYYVALDDGSDPVDLSASAGIRGSYFSEAENGTLYFFAAEGADGAGIYEAVKMNGAYETPRKLPPAVNDTGALTFGPCVDPAGETLIFSRYYEADGERPEGRSGLYESRRSSAGWGAGRKLPGIPYGWSATVAPDGRSLVFTDGRDLLMKKLPRSR